MDKCRICLRCRKNLLSINTKADGITFAEMITSIANVKLQNDNGYNKLCRTCRTKLTDAYNFKMDIERSEMVLQETSNMKRINFSNLNDIKIKIEIETDCKPVGPIMETFSEKLFKDGVDCLSYNNTLIKKIENISETEDADKKKSLSVGEFLNSIKTESDDECYQDYEIGAADCNSDSGSNYSCNNLLLRKTRKKKTKQTKVKGTKKRETGKTIQKDWSKHLLAKPIKPTYIEDLRLTRTELLNKKPRTVKKRLTVNSKLNVCPYCGKLSKSMNTHILLHTAERTFKCDQCPKGYFTAAALKSHINKHSQNKKYKCEHCIAAFHTKGALQNHMIMHGDDKKHVCDICNKAFKRKPILTRHKMIHNFGNKPIQCDLCPMTFITQYNLRHHMRVHTGERPFKCEICSQPYSYKHDFNRHCLKKHGVFLKRRSVHIMNEEVLQQERALMRDLSLRAQGIIKSNEIENPFDGPQAALAYEQTMKAIETNKIPIIF